MPTKDNILDVIYARQMVECYKENDFMRKLRSCSKHYYGRIRFISNTWVYTNLSNLNGFY